MIIFFLSCLLPADPPFSLFFPLLIQIFTLPEFELVFSCPNFPLSLPLLKDSLTSTEGTSHESPEVREILLSGLGKEAKKEPHLVVGILLSFFALTIFDCFFYSFIIGEICRWDTVHVQALPVPCPCFCKWGWGWSAAAFNPVSEPVPKPVKSESEPGTDTATVFVTACNSVLKSDHRTPQAL